MKSTWIVVALLLAMFLPSHVAAQEPGMGALYLTPKVTTPASVCGASGQGAPNNNYEMSGEKPAPGKAYTAMSGGGFACAFSFVHKATQESVLTGEFTVFLQVGCDVAGAAIELDYNFLVAGKSVSGAVRPSVSYQCTGGSQVFTYTQVFDGKDTGVKVGDAMTLTLSLFAAANGPAGASANWHIKTGHATTPSGVFGAGLPGGAAPPALEPLLASVESSTADATAGENASYTILIENNGTAAANYTAIAESLPDGFVAAFSAPNGTIEAASSATTDLTVGVPADAASGSYNFTVNVTTEGTGSVLLNLTLQVSAPASLSTSAETSPSNGTANATAASPAAADEASGIPNLSALLGLVVLVAAAIATRRKE